MKDAGGQVKHRSDLDELLEDGHGSGVEDGHGSGVAVKRSGTQRRMSTASMGFRRGLCRRGSPASSVHASPTGAQRHRPSDVVEAASTRVSRLGLNG